MNYRKGVFAIIIDEKDKFLLVKKIDYKEGWTVIGGGQKDGESLEQNLYREIEEELGIGEESFELIGVANTKVKYNYPVELAKRVHGGRYEGQIYTQCLLRFVGKKSDIKLCTIEFKDSIWVEGSKLKDYLIFPDQYTNHKRAIEEFLPDILDSVKK